jgi:DNA-directed RNA polymerase specialized sigma24 family protein
MTQLALALHCLEPCHRQVLILRHFQRLPLSEVASRMNRSMSATRRLWIGALGQLQVHAGLLDP